ncbi:UPF0272 protein [Kaistia sp. 32K]|uniref:LarC family nickel insertion protein n=1 Tax=Kaistia sp. 32K TaxID=2795690 RepID=UPI0019167865|nr:LarC family nickel insertion protein [Kaistia sp. 32K]BCP55233.1 UPF0272 protein [Kaistia sp. 32K]
MLHLHLDPLGGMAGDMFVAALLDLRPDLEPGLQAALARCPLIETVTCSLVAHDDGILTGRRFLVARPGAPSVGCHEPPDGHGHHHDHGTHGDNDHSHSHSHGDHDHVDWRRIRAAIAASALDAETRTHALGIFTLLAEAEARVHGRSVEDVRFHEVGAWDSIADIVAAAWLVAQLAPAVWTVGAIPIGGGRVRSAHGLLPVPAPATALLLEGFAMIDDGIGGERVTPTGAAILAYLCRGGRAADGARILRSSAHGFGTRQLPGISNCLRVLAYEATAGGAAASDRVAVLECEIDDQTGEDLALAVANLRSIAGVLDIVQAPVFGKKGRMMTALRILATPAARDAVIAATFDETTTLGIRHAIVERATLRRGEVAIDHAGRSYRAKIAERPSGRTAKIEADDIAATAGAATRSRLRAELDAALRAEGEEP